MIHETEVYAHAHILSELKTKKGWKAEQIYTQNQIQKIKEIKKQLGLKTPENILKIKEGLFYVIQSKSKRSMLKTAITEAQDYADKINKSKSIKALFVTGIAGNDDEWYDAENKFLHKGKWITITENKAELTGLLSLSEIGRVIETNNPYLEDMEISENEFLVAAEKINGILHENAIHKDYRAKFISALLLALSDKSKIDLDSEPMVLVKDINTRVDAILKKHKKDDFSRFVHIDRPSSEDNHVKTKDAIVKTIQELLSLNIHSAMKSGNDILGKFYEVFLKYGNGAKEIGIVLTPRHITRFAVDVLDIQPNDLVLDPTCGTGGFLVAAYDEVKKKCKNDKEFVDFSTHGLYGIEEQDPIVPLALVNMIFRGDGKTHIIEGNCFAKWLNAETVDGISASEYLKEDKENRLNPITKVLMNPPFPKKKTDKKEFLFVEHALKQMQDDGLLFCVLPYPCMIKTGVYQSWRQRMLKEHTLLSVITLPDDLFYPVGVHTIGLILKKGIPHPKEQNVFWIRAINDGHRKSKGKRLLNSKVSDDYKTIKESLKSFIKDQNTTIPNKTRFYKTCPINFSDKILELIPEYYLDDKLPEIEEIQEGVELALRGMVAYMINHRKEALPLK